MTSKVDKCHYFITDDDIGHFKREIASGKMPNKFKKLLEVLLDDTIEHPFLRKAPTLCCKIVPLLNKGVKNETISKELVDKVLIQFKKHKVFTSGDFREDVAIRSQYGTKVYLNGHLLALTFDYFRKELSDVSHKRRKEIDLPEFRISAVEALRTYVYTGTCTTIDNIDQLAEMYDWLLSLEDPSLTEFAEKMVLERASKVQTKKTLETFASEFNSDFVANEQFYARLQDRVLKSYLTAQSIKYVTDSKDATSPLMLEVAHLGLMDDPGELGEMVDKRIEGVIIDGDEQIEEINLLEFMDESLRCKIKIIYFVQPTPTKPLLQSLAQQFPDALSIHLSHPPKQTDAERDADIAVFQGFFPKLENIHYYESDDSAA